MYYINQPEPRSVLGSLRSLIPNRSVQFEEAKKIAEVQANRLLAHWEVTDGPVPSEVVSELPRVQVVRDSLAVSGASRWQGGNWVILLNRHESWARQRFTLMHEFKHIIDHYSMKQLYTGTRHQSADDQSELVADYFAGCVLMPKRLLKRAWSGGLHTPQELADYFDVSAMAADVRLSQTNLSAKRDRCPRPVIGRFNRRHGMSHRLLVQQGGTV